ncbi:hypothetical protein [Microbacterium sp. H1-D42]|uniref:hypothetical protein n=1 Tax=Microbacterium sp. H1-D42 TaxID=2925844 RepID=UPI001F5340AA|nr:hypothetical protein [Microbacterium sp. H1-D42]UNK69725.1 hypothetical protein MNR00_11140 [Microbacterium sp. H1-D42]
MKIVVFAPTADDIRASLATLTDHAEVTVVSAAHAQWDGAYSVAVGGSGIRERLSEYARRTPPGRVLRRLTPLDPGAMFAHRVRRSADAGAAIAEADLLVSTERDAHFAVWRTARDLSARGRRISAVAGFPAARAAVDRFSRDY